MVNPISSNSCVARLVAVLGSLLSPLAAQLGKPGETGTLLGDPTLPTQRSKMVVRHGITWHFDRDYVVGSYANGDPWVVGPVEIVAIEPRCHVREGRILNGAMIDPDPASLQQGYDSALFGVEERRYYRAELNVASGIGPHSALHLQPGASLVSVVSRPEAPVVPQLAGAAVLTCVVTVPAPDAFRPPYVRGDKEPGHRAVELDFRVLQKLPAVPGTPPIEAVSRAFERLWLDHFPSELGRWAHPLENMPDHPRDLAALVGNGALLLQTDLPDEQKRELYVRMVQLGIDLHAVLRGGGRWPGLGMHGGGRKLPILLAGLALADARMLAIGREFAVKPGGGKASAFFGEDCQSFQVRETSIGVWNGGHGGYAQPQAGQAEWGYAHADDPTRDDIGWLAPGHRLQVPVSGWVGEALAARLLGLQAAWNHAPFFELMDRYMADGTAAGPGRAWVGWHAVMWDAYRSNF